jgi:hypothetical protein
MNNLLKTIFIFTFFLDNNRIIKQLTREETFNADSLYNKSSEPIKTAENIRINARFKPASIDHEFKRVLLQAIDKYLNARSKKDSDPVLDELYSPFIYEGRPHLLLLFLLATKTPILLKF